MFTKAYAKINLGLNVIKDSFKNTLKHKVETIMMLIESLYDGVELNIADTNHLITYFEASKEIFIQSCLIKRTLEFLEKKYQIKNKYNIIINKNIPLGSGLGGGSSDAATVMKMIFALENKSLDIIDLKEVALELGSDIPFFLMGYKKAFVSDFGNNVQKLEFQPKFKFNVHLLKIQVHTKRIFDEYLCSKEPVEFTNFLKVIDVLKHDAFSFDIHNSLQNPCFKLYPEIKQKYLELMQKHSFCILTGSGSTLITIDSDVINCPKIRTRYAPSPTGYFHIGGARTALFNYLFAKKNNGDFIVRIEDTDFERNVQGGIESQLDNLKWMGLFPDESVLNPGKYGPYKQSLKLDRYKKLANKLFSEKKAYRCFCTKEKLELDRLYQIEHHQTPKYRRTCLLMSDDEIKVKLEQKTPFVYRLKIDENKDYEWEDLIRGHISVPGLALTDPVILKSNDYPMYNFAVVIDDYDMEISHVLRGEEHISNTPYQLAITDALGYKKTINYGHLSVIIDETGKKLSKRNETLKQFIEDYKKMGFIPQALDNFLSLLGWAPSDNQEIFNLSTAIEKFDIFAVSKSPTFFDCQKMLWIANEHFKKIENQPYLDFVKPFLSKQISESLKDNLDEILLLFKQQLSYACQLNDLISEMFFDNDKNIDEEMKIILVKNFDVLESFKKTLLEQPDFNEINIKQAIELTKQETTKKGKDLFMPIRIATTKSMHGPELAKNIYLLGKEQILKNLNFCLELIL